MSGPELVIHGHFYQPPRENPWTEEVGRERSASPYHDWNERITAECYRPNTLARIISDDGHVIAIVDNLEHLSFNVGPTLLSWMEREEPETYRRILEADRVGGGAIAQAHGHVILPLATEDDIRTQIRWGLADFRHRFGREAKGMWLSECAVNDTVLRILAEEGVGFTILAPGQAASTRPLGSDSGRAWRTTHGRGIDTSQPYRWLHPSGDGRGIDIVFYDGGLSHAAAFELSTMSSQSLIDRMANSAPEGFVTLATDGETFGHHHKFAERLIAYALSVEAPRRSLTHSNLNRVLEQQRPKFEVRVHESAWSCAHGVGRWREDCGCSTGGGPGWNQRWRAPLRQALDELRATVAQVANRRGAEVFDDPNRAFDEYVGVLLGATTREVFAKQHVTAARIGDDEHVEKATVTAFTLLEMQRFAMSMFTSCGWFFNDVSGIETVQVLRYAARVMDLLGELGEPVPLDSFLAHLTEARSNLLEEGTGADVWRRYVEPARVDARRVVEHVALTDVLERKVLGWMGPYDVTIGNRRRDERGSLVLSSGVARITHRRTGRSWDFAYAALGLGGLEVSGVLRPVVSSEEGLTAIDPLRRSFETGVAVSGLLRTLGAIGEHDFDLTAALPDEAERLMQDTADALTERYTDAYEVLYESHRATLEDLTLHGYSLPPALLAPAQVALEKRFREAVASAHASTDPAAYEAAVSVARAARAAGFEVDSPSVTLLFQRLLDDAVRHAVAHPTNDSVHAALQVLTLKWDLNIPVNLEPAQELVYFSLQNSDGAPALRGLAKALRIQT